MCQERQRDTHSTGSGGCDPVMAGGETQLTARRKAEWWGVPSLGTSLGEIQGRGVLGRSRYLVGGGERGSAEPSR